LVEGFEVEIFVFVIFPFLDVSVGEGKGQEVSDPPIAAIAPTVG
jgi:hypothetical protein